MTDVTRRSGFIIMLAANHSGVAVLFLIAFTAPDAVWSARVIFVVLGLLLLTIGNWFVVKDWGPNGREARLDRELERIRAGRDMQTMSCVLPAAAFAHGALVSNGWRSVWNRIPAGENARARGDILECAG